MEKIKLGDLCKPSGRQIKEDKDTLIDYIDISAVDNETKKVTGYQTITFGESPSRARKAVKRGNILVSTVRPNLNAVALLEEDTPNVSVASTGFCVLESKDDVDPRFIFNFCKSKPFIDDMVSQATGASYPAVSDKIVRSALIPKYSYQEQQHISNVLDKLAGIIDSRRIELQKLDNLIKARFVELFGDIKDTCEVGYYIKSLTAGKSLAGEAECANKVLKTGAASFDFFDATQVKNLPLDYEPQEEHLVNPGDIIISRMNTAELTGAAAYVWDVQDKVYLPDRLWKANLTDGCNPIFVWQMLIQPSTKEQIRRECSGTSGSMKNISKPGMLAIKVKKVPLELQNQFAEFVKQVDKSKVAVKKALDETQTLFDSFMQEYFG